MTMMQDIAATTVRSKAVMFVMAAPPAVDGSVYPSSRMMPVRHNYSALKNQLIQAG
jgi:hypothetical protein